MTRTPDQINGAEQVARAEQCQPYRIRFSADTLDVEGLSAALEQMPEQMRASIAQALGESVSALV
jgi:hypothetical protein